jgi:glutamyl-tRNA synthetase
MDNNYLAELLFPDVSETPDDMEKKYPPRNLPEGAKVTRFAPSPTGFIHLGNLYGVMTDERLAHQSGGIMYLRIEDTDKKREVKNGVAIIINLLSQFGLQFDEGATVSGDNGAYGPYRQSQRAHIYHVYAKQLVREGKAYPCFCTAEELKAIRDEQKALKVTPGYYGKWAVWRDADIEKIKSALDLKRPYVLRYRSEGKEGNTFKFTDLVKGVIDVSENFIDHVILKSDGIPDYHFAHAVDDHLMRTTHVVRDESWLPSLPFHIQLFKALGFAMPKYIHTAQVMKLDNGKKRKLSKRKDPEFGMSYFYSAGYPIQAASEYLLTLLNSNFEEWRIANPDKSYTEFPFSVKKMSASGCLFDFVKLNDISKNVISRMSTDEVFRQSLDWAKEFDKPFAAQLSSDPDYAKSVISIGRGGKKPRKDYGTWVELKNYMQLFYDDTFAVTDAYPEGTDAGDVKTALKKFLETYTSADDQNTWFEKIKKVATSLGYAADMKDYKANPGAYRGSVADISMFLRVAVTGKLNSPDMYTVMQILGEKRVRARIEAFLG